MTAVSDSRVVRSRSEKLSYPPGGRLASKFRRGTRYVAEIFDGADDALAAIDTIQQDLTTTGFQSLNWLTVHYEELAAAEKATPRLVVITDQSSGEVALALPLLIKREKWLKVARFADLGVTDYGAPMLGPAPLTKPRHARRIWSAVRSALSDVDVIELQRMPTMIGGRKNPLLSVSGVVPSRNTGFQVRIDIAVDDFIASRGKKFRKEVERCRRVWQREGGARFYRAESPEDIARVYSVLEDQQGVRQAELGNSYVLDRPAYRAFYERLAMDGSDVGLGHIFAIEAQGEVVATLFGIAHDDTFTMLRISFGGERWSHLSPGRLVILEAAKLLSAAGIHVLDMGIGDYVYKRRFGASEVKLHDIVVANRLAGRPYALYQRTKARLRHRRAIANAELKGGAVENA